MIFPQAKSSKKSHHFLVFFAKIPFPRPPCLSALPFLHRSHHFPLLKMHEIVDFQRIFLRFWASVPPKFSGSDSPARLWQVMGGVQKQIDFWIFLIAIPFKENKRLHESCDYKNLRAGFLKNQTNLTKSKSQRIDHVKRARLITLNLKLKGWTWFQLQKRVQKS